jgi:hypothetical protein
MALISNTKLTRPSLVPREMDQTAPVADFVAIGVAVLFTFAAGVQLTQSDGDLLAYIRLGDVILTSGELPPFSLFGLADAGAPATYPAWLAAVVFATLRAWGGLALVIVLTAVIAGITQGLLTDLLRRHGVPPVRAVAASLISFLLASAHWLARPHLFSMLFAVLLLLLLESDRKWAAFAAFPLFVLWSNLHGGWAFGLILAVAYLAGDAHEWRRTRDSWWRVRALRHTLLVALAAVGTLVNPYGARLHRTVLETLSDASVARTIDEYQPPGLTEPADIAFFAALAFCVFAVWRTRRMIPAPWLLVALATTLMALRASRNIAFFGLVAWPLVVLHVAGVHPGRALALAPAPSTARPFGIWAVPVFSLLAALGLASGRIFGVSVVPTEPDPARFPVAAVER